MAISYLLNKDTPHSVIQQAPKATTDVPQAPTTPGATPSNDIVKSLGNQVTKAIQPGAGSYFDPRYESTVNSINQAKAVWGSGVEKSKQRIGEDFTSNVGEAGKVNERNQGTLQAKLGTQGIGFSSVNVGEQGRLGEAYQNVLDQLNKGKTRGLEDIEFQNTIKQGEFQNMLTEAELDKSERQITAEKEQAAAAAQAEAAKLAADANRLWMEELTSSILSSVQPVPTPTGKMTLPQTKPAVVIPKAVAAVPPPTKQLLDPNQTKEAQGILRLAGYDPGPMDGMMGPKTIAAFNAYRQARGMPTVNSMGPGEYKELTDWLWSTEGFDGSTMNTAPSDPQATAERLNQQFASNPQLQQFNVFGRR